MINLFVCGDIVNYKKLDGMICDESLAKIIKSADYSICNFEAPIESEGKPTSKIGPHHFQRPSIIKGLKKQGFDLMCLANNHIMDFGEQGLMKTIKRAKEEGLDTLGAGANFDEAYKPLVKHIKDMKIGFINACEAQFGVIDYSSQSDSPGYAWINHHEIDRLIIELKSSCDIVIVLSHAGLENFNIPQEEWRSRYKHFCNLGADVVIGSHPHVPQGYEHYNDSIIFYSLGNFYFDSDNFIDKEDLSFSVVLKLEKGEKVKFEIISHYKKEGKVQLSTNKTVDLNALNSLLGNNYEELQNDMSLRVYNTRLRQRLIYSLLPIPYDGKFITTVKRLISILLGRSKKVNKELVSLHLLRNEAYYFAIRRALRLIAQKKGEQK